MAYGKQITKMPENISEKLSKLTAVEKMCLFRRLRDRERKELDIRSSSIRFGLFTAWRERRGLVHLLGCCATGRSHERPSCFTTRTRDLGSCCRNRLFELTTERNN